MSGEQVVAQAADLEPAHLFDACNLRDQIV